MTDRTRQPPSRDDATSILSGCTVLNLVMVLTEEIK